MAQEELFQPIEKFGSPEKDLSEKVEVVGRAEDILTYLGVQSELITEVAELREQTAPLTTLVLARKPIEIERLDLEGRGAYHKHVKFHGTEAVVYVKGTGNEKAFDQAPGDFPGFPSEADKLFFDDLFMQQHPRILGTETLTWGLLELINSSVLFAQLAEKYQWQSLTEAIEAGVTIPLSVTHYKELSSYLQSLLQRAIDQSQDKLDKKTMQWQGNFIGMGSVAQVVPSCKRLAGGIAEAEDKEKFRERITDSQVIETSGRTLRELFDAGYVYSQSSSHGQNLYDRGLVAQADNSDLVFLGDFQTEHNYQWSKILTLDIPASLKRTILIFKQLQRSDLLTPLHYPIPEENISWDTVVAIQEKFWGELLKGYVHENAIPGIACLIPYMRTEINLAAAQTLIENADQQRWDELAKRKESIMSRYAAQGVPEEYGKKKQYNLDATEQYPMYTVLENDRLPVSAWKKFMQTGDIQDLLQDPRIADMIMLAQAIESIRDTSEKESLIRLCGRYFGMRDPQTMRRKPDQIAYFAGAHARLMVDLITQNRVEEATKVVNILLTSKASGYDYYHIEGGYEASSFIYPRMLLTTDNINEVYEQFLFDFYLQAYQRETIPFSFAQIVRNTLNEADGKAPPKETYDMLEYSKEHNLPRPDDIIRPFLGAYLHDERHRTRITNWLYEYQYLRLQLQDTVHPHPNPEEIIAKQDAMAVSVQTEYPELTFGYNCIMANYYKETDPDRATIYFTNAVSYYENLLEQRQALLSEHLASVKVKGQEEYTSISNLAQQYKDLGFPLIARHFTNRAEGNYFGEVWQ